MGAFKREELFPGIYFNGISDDRYKTNKISVHMMAPLKEETTSAYALVPALLRKGYQDYEDFTEFNRYLDQLYGADVNFGIQKYGDNQVLTLSITGLDDKYTLEQEKLTEELANVLFNMLLHPVMENGVFRAGDFELERNQLIDEIEAEINDKRTYALNTSAKLMCQGEPYGISEYGTVEQVQALDAKQVTKAYHELLGSARIEIMFVGCGNPETAKAVAAAKLKRLSRSAGDVRTNETKVHQPLENTIEHTDRMDITQSKMVLGFATGIEPAAKDIYALRMFVMVLGGTPTSKLFLNVREKLSLCYYCAASMDKSKGIMRIDSGVENENIQKAREEIFHQIEEVKQGNITEEELQYARLSIMNTYRTISDSVNGMEGFYLGQILCGTSCTPEEEAASLQQVAAEDIIAAAKKLRLDIAYVLTGKE